MRGGLPARLARVAQMLARLPGVGEKTAQRYALFFATTADEATARELGTELVTLREHVRPCERCNHIAEVGEDGRARCAICLDTRRDGTLLCIVARVQDLLAIERSGAMRGRYFVLGRLLSPLEGVGAEDLPLEALRSRLQDPGEPIREVLVATPPSVDGEATALLLAREMGAMGIQVSRIASGVPHGGDLEFADQVTLGRAIEGRKSFG
ncbi:Recombination protein RecR [Chondromyces apiculatus DSM 436]|uniref:Recombination protein RecR n=1 Tax=Chondromyces apiculatus DSM 436 TaxID=1192034 RepID=A0A017T9M1_9BACT|nr:recombination mediator RecR [Chondromyces apiculatus]EYF05612.1 Recombination protein RecR [Chondromyces apiculatus DSM 436]